MIHPHTQLQFISEEKGFGVVATKFIPKGTITWIMDELDRTFSPQKIESLDPLYRDTMDKYCYRDNMGNYVFCWDIARFVNHSFSSNCLSTAYNFELAIRDIYPGEELTDDYGYLNASEPYEFPKEDGSPRTHVFPDDLLNYHKEWDAMLVEAFKSYNSVEQPLAKLIESQFKEKVRKVAEGQEKMDSILNCYFNGEVVKDSGVRL
jgi:uncharacterized protein